ncbi:hypothetical protein TTHERM_000313829 (macronuclear) [Tetrahymena thermophila SB210]|uniref:Uncharacterized protein n=1 Tax=Tetrahymena thermophila (strain SB210) TaxID=312017 RepID=W7WZE0_TETTS|nr:hypothetical protein TTHERM_000313829 [Tetrahymena thermophila SB210]EWS72265.1 hypothetical protein TTHERM_000313829 [Tetrahymena thermophila SB210]|eukprot:XP_012655205.1 hypothetical protein TTHERM_000313829 [Tetrahymena thermophila SB210]
MTTLNLITNIKQIEKYEAKGDHQILLKVFIIQRFLSNLIMNLKNQSQLMFEITQLAFSTRLQARYQLQQLNHLIYFNFNQSISFLPGLIDNISVSKQCYNIGQKVKKKNLCNLKFFSILEEKCNFYQVKKKSKILKLFSLFKYLNVIKFGSLMFKLISYNQCKNT